MMKRTLLLVALIIVGAVEAKNVISMDLSSWNTTYYEETLDSDVLEMRLTQQYSNTNCTLGYSFGFEGAVVWVNNDCRGQFTVVLDTSEDEAEGRDEIAITSVEASTVRASDPPSNAIDNDVETYYHSNGANPWFDVYFNSTSVFDVDIVNRLGGSDVCESESQRYICLVRLEDTRVSLWKDGSEVKHCGTITEVDLSSLEEADQTYTVTCGGEVGDMIRLNRTGNYLHFAEIRVYKYAGRDEIAITSIDASTYTSTNPPSNAIDNDIDTFYHSDGSNPWIDVYFNSTSVFDVEIVNRLGGSDVCLSESQRYICLARLEDARVSLWKDGNEVKHCGTITEINLSSLEEADQTYTVTCGGEVGDMIRVNRTGYYLHFAEIRVYEHTGNCFVENFAFSGADIRTVQSVPSADICLDLCVKKDGCSSIEYEVSSQNCTLKNLPYGENPTSKTGITSANIACLARHLLTYADCIKTDYNYQTADVSLVASEISSIQDCVVECQQVDGCLSVAYQANTSDCWLKYRPQNADEDGVDSVAISCLGGVVAARYSCLERDVNYQGADIKQVSSIHSVVECVELCRVEEECESVTHRPSTQDCWLKSKRNGDNTVYLAGVNSVNLMCVIVAHQGTNACLLEDYDFYGADLELIPNVANIADCLAECADTDSCVSVTHQPSSLNCWLKDKRTGDSSQDMGGVNSQNLFCRAGRSTSCIEEDYDYYGADISYQGDVASVEECVTLCQDVDECVSIAYEASSNGCWFKSKKNGETPAAKTGVDSVNLYCQDGGTYSYLY